MKESLCRVCLLNRADEKFLSFVKYGRSWRSPSMSGGRHSFMSVARQASPLVLILPSTCSGAFQIV